MWPFTKKETVLHPDILKLSREMTQAPMNQAMAKENAKRIIHAISDKLNEIGVLLRNNIEVKDGIYISIKNEEDTLYKLTQLVKELEKEYAIIENFRSNKYAMQNSGLHIDAIYRTTDVHNKFSSLPDVINSKKYTIQQKLEAIDSVLLGINFREERFIEKLAKRDLPVGIENITPYVKRQLAA